MTHGLASYRHQTDLRHLTWGERQADITWTTVSRQGEIIFLCLRSCILDNDSTPWLSGMPRVVEESVRRPPNLHHWP